MKLYNEIMTKYLPSADKEDGNYLYGISIAYTMVDILKRAGRDLTRKKVMDARQIPDVRAAIPRVR